MINHSPSKTGECPPNISKMKVCNPFPNVRSVFQNLRLGSIKLLQKIVASQKHQHIASQLHSRRQPLFCDNLHFGDLSKMEIVAKKGTSHVGNNICENYPRRIGQGLNDVSCILGGMLSSLVGLPNIIANVFLPIEDLDSRTRERSCDFELFARM